MNFPDVFYTAGALGAGLNAGIFFAFSTFIMRALASLTTAEGVRAMQAINKTVITPLFMLVFMGTAVIALAEIIRFAVLPDSRNAMALAAALLYLLGTFGTTIRFNVPRNNRLEACEPESSETKAVWKDYLVTWTYWNHARTLAATLSTMGWTLA
ncbi:MAG: anthrone oxygenase family protein [Verrucomicrobiota bacterium]